MTSLWFVAYDRPHGLRERRHAGHLRGGGHALPARPRGPRLRAPVVEVRRGQGAGGPREVRHVLDALLPGAQRADRPARGAGPRPAAGAPAPASACRASARPLRAPPRVRGVSVRRSPRPDEGFAMSSPLAMMSAAAVALAGITFLFTDHDATAPRPETAALAAVPAPVQHRV